MGKRKWYVVVTSLEQKKQQKYEVMVMILFMNVCYDFAESLQVVKLWGTDSKQPEQNASDMQ